MRGYGNTPPDTAPALTVGQFGGTWTFDPEHGWRVDGEPYNPDGDGVHRARGGIVSGSKVEWGKTLSIPDRYLGAGEMPDVAAAEARERRLRELRELYGVLWAQAMEAMRRALFVQTTPRWARAAGKAIAAVILVGAIRDGLRR